MKGPAPHGVCWITDFFVAECRERGCIPRCAKSLDACVVRPATRPGPVRALFPACPVHSRRDEYDPADIPEAR